MLMLILIPAHMKRSKNANAAQNIIFQLFYFGFVVIFTTTKSLAKCMHATYR